MSHQKTVPSFNFFTSLDIAECRFTNDTLKLKLKNTSNSLVPLAIPAHSLGGPPITLRFKPHILTSLKPIPPTLRISQCKNSGLIHKIKTLLGITSSNPCTLFTMLSAGNSLKIELNSQLIAYEVISKTQSPFEESLLLFPLKDTMVNPGATLN